MSRAHRPLHLYTSRVTGVAALVLLSAAAGAQAQQNLPEPPAGIRINPQAGTSVTGGTPSTFMQVPVSNLSPGAVRNPPLIKNPVANDPQALQRGMTYFNSLNCVGCHMPNGGGGMGPALSNTIFIYGSQPEQIYLSIYQGRPRGMPAWGASLPDSVIWDLVTYIGSISNEPTPEWGRTTSIAPPSPKIQQVPVEMVQTPQPWSQTQTFGFGQKP
jgi:cytochrome c oxidase cbb3-type subunit III